MLLRLDCVYAIFPVFFIVIVIRMLLLSVRHLVEQRLARDELDRWSGEPSSESKP